MLGRLLKFMRDRVPGFHRMERLPRQLLGISPFEGDVKPTRVPIFGRGSGRPTLPFPHPWNYDRPIRILETYFWGADAELGSGRHNRYIDVPGFATVLVTRDPRIIRAITTETGDRDGQFDRDTLPSGASPAPRARTRSFMPMGHSGECRKNWLPLPLAKPRSFSPNSFKSSRKPFGTRCGSAWTRWKAPRRAPVRRCACGWSPRSSPCMLEMLVNNFFGAEIAHEEITNRYVPALERVIDHIVRDTVINKLGIPLWGLPSFTKKIAQAKEAYAHFEKLTDLALAARKEGKGLWNQFKSDATDQDLRSNIKVFLAGALEATTSYASWAISHLARNQSAQEKVYEEVKNIEDYTPEILDGAKYLGHVLDETLRLTPSLYFLPRRATADVWIQTADGSKLMIPKGTHILLDVWHANRHEDHWGVRATGHPALDFVPERWENLAAQGRGSKEVLHFGFGHGPRVCPGKHLGQLEVGLVVGAFVKLFRFKAVHRHNPPRVGVSTKPLDGALAELELRHARSREGMDVLAVRRE